MLQYISSLTLIKAICNLYHKNKSVGLYLGRKLPFISYINKSWLSNPLVVGFFLEGGSPHFIKSRYSLQLNLSTPQKYSFIESSGHDNFTFMKDTKIFILSSNNGIQHNKIKFSMLDYLIIILLTLTYTADNSYHFCYMLLVIIFLLANVSKLVTFSQGWPESSFFNSYYTKA